MKNRRLDPTLVLDGWPALDAGDDGAFADRVLAALDAPARAVTPSKRWPLYACALAVAGLFAPLLFVPRSAPSASSSPSSSINAPIIAHGPDLDLGQQTD